MSSAEGYVNDLQSSALPDAREDSLLSRMILGKIAKLADHRGLCAHERQLFTQLLEDRAHLEQVFREKVATRPEGT